MNRRDFMKAFGIGAAVAFSAQTHARVKRPNLLIIHTDQLHSGTLGCYGGTIVGTPHIDWLAANGARCERFYATSPVCSPSRAALVSGCYPQSTPVEGNNVPLDDAVVTFAEILRREGYATGYAGKWHLDGEEKPQWAPEREFGFEDNRFMFNRGHWKKLEDTPEGPRVAARDKKGKPSYDVDGADEKSYTTDWLATKTIEFIESHKDESFCYMVSIPDPHGPNTVRAPYGTMYQDVEVPIPRTLNKTEAQTPVWARNRKKEVSAEELRKMLPKYYGQVKCIDDNVGRILETLRKNGLLDSTIVVFTADHGDMCGEHGRLDKGVPYEGSARIPFLLYYPDKVNAGSVVGPVLSCVDFLPTILALMGVSTAGTEEGRDASTLFTGADSSNWNDIAFLRIRNDWLCALNSRYKLVYSTKGDPWLFDLEKDPEELVNYFHDEHCRRVVRELTKALKQYAVNYRDKLTDDARIRQDMLEALSS